MRKTFQGYILTRWFWFLAIAIMACAGSSKAASYSAEELDTLVSTIALYPDPLLAHVLTASTHNNEISSASLWASAHKHLKGESLSAEMQRAELDYDESVLALVPFPTVLATMAKYSTWTSQLGEAVKNQNGEVIFAVQRMRHAAYDHGYLKSDQYVKVNRDVYITIEPVKTEYIYVPVYNPSVVYYVYTDQYIPMRYSHAVWTGHWYSGWVWGDIWFEWQTHAIRHHPRPPRHNRHYNVPPKHNSHTYAPAPQQRNDHRLPAKETSYRPLAKKQTVQAEAPRPTYTKVESSVPKEEAKTSERSSSNPFNLTRNKKSSPAQSGSGNEDDHRNSDHRSHESSNQNSGGFHRSMRR